MVVGRSLRVALSKLRVWNLNRLHSNEGFKELIS